MYPISSSVIQFASTLKILEESVIFFCYGGHPDAVRFCVSVILVIDMYYVYIGVGTI